MLTPRALDGQQPRTLFGVVPRGTREGVLSMAPGKDGTWQGIYVSAAALQETRASLAHIADDDTLELRLTNGPPVRFRRLGPVNGGLLQSINIIGHRGLSLGQPALQNSVDAIRNSWLFGCSGVEVDVTVPYSVDGEPLAGSLKVYHPPDWRAEITGRDSVSAAALVRAEAPDLQDVLRTTAQVGVPFVYIDAKLRWLLRSHRRAARESVERIVATAKAHLAAGARQIIAIGTETSGQGEAADIIVGTRQHSPWPENLLWALEVTRGTRLDDTSRRLLENEEARRPDLVSFNLLRVSGGGGGFLRLFVSTIPARVEQSFRRTRQPVIYWTAHDEGQFEGALRAIEKLTAERGRDAGIITPYPHRLAFYLATRERR